MRQADLQEHLRWIELAVDAARSGFDRQPNAFNAVQLAALHLALGDPTAARSLARTADRLARAESSFWGMIVQGEAAAIALQWETSKEWFARARMTVSDVGRWDGIARHLKFIINGLTRCGCSVPEHWIGPVIGDRSIAIIAAGNRGDWTEIHSDGVAQTARKIAGVRACVLSLFSATDLEIFSRLAGSAELHVIAPQIEDIPQNQREHARSLLQTAASVRSVDCSIDCLQQPSRVRWLSDFQRGLAALLADRYCATLPVDHTDQSQTDSLSAFDGRNNNDSTRSSGEQGPMHILSCDLARFSTTPDREALPRLLSFWQLVNESLRDRSPDVINPSGDGIVMAFQRAGDAAQVALAIQRRIRQLGLSARIGIHSGFVACADNPLTGRLDVAGSTVNIASRIEPTCPEGQILVSESFAALAMAEAAEGAAYNFEYVGEISLPKNCGKLRCHHLVGGGVRGAEISRPSLTRDPNSQRPKCK